MVKKLLTVSEAAHLLGISTSTLRRLEKNGVVEGYGLKVIYTPGGQRRYILDEIQHLYSQQGFSGKIGHGKRPVVLIRDFTRAFTNPMSRLSIQLKNQPEAIRHLIVTAQTHQVPVIFSKLVYDPSIPFSAKWGQKFPSLQVLKRDSEWIEIHPELQDLQFDLMIETPYITDLYQSPVESFLRERKIDTIILAGVTTSGSIRATAIECFQKGFYVLIPEEAVGDRNEAIHNTSLLDLNARYVDVVSLESAVKYLHECKTNASMAGPS